MARQTRSTLKALFRDGATDRAYIDLIDSGINISDDGINTDKDNGLVLTPKGASKQLISFFENIGDQTSPLWSVSLDENGSEKSLDFSEKNQSRLFLQAGGNIGIGTNTPNYKLEVRGLAAMQGRVGNYTKGYLNADGKWHTIPVLSNLDGCRGYEIMAHINDEGDRRFGLTYGIMLMSHGTRGYKNKVRTVEAGSSWIWGKIWNKIKFRWAIDPKNSIPEKEKYMIQIRSRTHYGMSGGKPKKIFFRVSLLWDKDYELERYPDRDVLQRPNIQAGIRPPVRTTPPKPGGGIVIKKSGG